MLRRFMCLISAVALLLCLCACESVKIPFRAEPFTADVTFQSAGIDIKGEFTYNSPEDMVLVINEPENIRGLTFSSNEEKTDVSISDISFVPDAKKESGVYILFDTLKAVGESDISLALSGEEKISLTVNDSDCIITFDCDNKRIVSAQIKGYNYKFE